MRVAFVLHGHLPWVRGHGTHPCGEEWLFQSWAETYLPLLAGLERLAEEGARDVLTLGLTPVLAEQMEDPRLLADFHGWLGRRPLDLAHTVSRYGQSDRDRLRPTWAAHWRHLQWLLARFEAGPARTGLVAPLRDLADAGVIQLLGGPPAHPYLPLIDRPEVLQAHLADGMARSSRALGRRPAGVWTPECGYRPAGTVADPTVPAREHAPGGAPVLARGEAELPGLEQAWAHAGADHLVLDGPTLVRGEPLEGRSRAPHAATDHPVRVGDGDLVAYGRNLALSYAVWSPEGGYPGDPWYRDFHAIDLEGGFKSWRVTDQAALAKEPYDPEAAAQRVTAHVEDFLARCSAHAEQARAHASDEEPPIAVAAFDAELFGHWWHEGPAWLEATLRALRSAPHLSTTTLAGDRARRSTPQRLALPESSWGAGKGHAAWVSPATHQLWARLRAAEGAWAALPTGERRTVAWRQLALAEASDWPFLINRDQSRQYAHERVDGHLEDLAAAAQGRDLAALTARDDPAGAVITSLASG